MGSCAGRAGARPKLHPVKELTKTLALLGWAGWAGLGWAAHDALSARELAVMRRIASEKTVSEIAAELNLSVKTISTYHHRILEKMNLRNNSEIIRYAVGEGLTD